MTHPLHKPHKIVECAYVFGITAEVNEEYWDIFLRETEETRKFVKKHLWTSEDDSLYIELSKNNKHAIITFPCEIIRTVRIAEEKLPERTNDSKVKRIKEQKDHKKKQAEFHEFLKKLGLSFDIDFHNYREDTDYMRVTYRGKEVFSGTTDDLQTKGSKESQ